MADQVTWFKWLNGLVYSKKNGLAYEKKNGLVYKKKPKWLTRKP